MASFTVTTMSDVGDDGTLASSISVDAADGGGLSLRKALGWAFESGETSAIAFAAAPGDAFDGGGLVLLREGQLETSGEVTIDGDLDGDGISDVTIDGGGASRVSSITTDGTIRGLVVPGDSADAGGVAVEAGARLRFEDGIVAGNSSSGNGGGIHSAGDATFVGATISHNSAVVEGGGVNVIAGSEIDMRQVAIVGNTAMEDGGGVMNTGVADLSNVTVAENRAGDDGGGIYSEQGSILILVHATLTGNAANDQNAGIRNKDTALANNTIILGNTAAVDDEFGGRVGGTSRSNLIEGDAAAVFERVDPVTGGGVLSNNSGPVATVALRDDPSNPALDAAEGAAALALNARGVARSQGAQADIGAFEVFVEAPLVTPDVIVSGLGADRPESEGDDELDVGESDDVLHGAAGNNTLRCGSGDDRLFGGAGNDELRGGLGAHRLSGHRGDDAVFGGKGADVLRGGGGNDTLHGGGGDDDLHGGRGADVLDGGRDHVRDFRPGEDVLRLDRSLWNETIEIGTVLERYGSMRGGDPVLDFGGRNVLVIEELGRQPTELEVDLL